MALPIIQTSFNAGELAPSLWGHVDLAAYKIGLSTARNGFISYRGGYYSRAGTAFVGFSKQTGRTVPPRIITFQFSINQGLVLEFGNLYMRVISNGEFVVETATNISGITQANPGVITDNAHGYSNGDWVFLDNIAGMTQLNGVTAIVANKTTNTYTLTDVYGNAINTTGYGVYTGGGTASRIYTLPTPYAEADLDWIKFTQSADVMSLCCWNQITGTLYAPLDLERLADDDWELNPLIVGTTIAAPTNATATAQSTNTATTYYSYVVTALDPLTGEESIASNAANIENNDIALYSGTNTISWNRVAGVQNYNYYGTLPSYGQPVPVGSAYGYLGTAFGAQAVDTNVIPDFSTVPPMHVDPFAVGAIIDIVPTAGGNGNYSAETASFAIDSVTGSGFVGQIVIVDGDFAGVIIQNGGKNYTDADTITISDTGGGLAAGFFTFSAQPEGGSDIVINGVSYQLSTSTTPPPNFSPIESTLPLTLQSLANTLNSSTKLSVSVATYSSDATNLYITYKTPGTDGNAFTMSADGSSNATPNNPTLTGGGTAGSGATGTLTIGPQSGTYPSVVAYFQERRVYASSPNNPDTYWMSQPGSFTNFDSRVPTIDSDSITGTPWSVEVNGIQWMVSMPGGLVTLTGLSAWQLTGAGGSSLNPQPITPASQQAQPQAYNGISPTVAPIKIDYDVIYLQAKGSIFRDLSYNFFTNIYTGTDITYLSSHLFQDFTILASAYCEEPYKIMWALRDDNTLLSLTYLKAQEVMAWTRHDTQGQIWSICSVTEPPVDALYLATQRAGPALFQAAYMIERMDNRFWDTVEECWCVDAGLELEQPAPNTILVIQFAAGAGIPTGVTGLVGGEEYSNETVAFIVDSDGTGPGTGAIVTLTIVAGIVTGVAIAGGENYLYPALVITDPTGSGSGASATVTLDNSSIFLTEAPAFNAGMVGNVIRAGGGRATITSYVSSQEVVANVTSPMYGATVNPSAGEWTVTAPVTVIGGLNHLIGQTVTGLADGLVIPPQVVSAAATITLATPATAGIVGLGFTAQMQSLYLDAGSPTQQGRRKKVAAVTARFENSAVTSVQGGSNQPDGSALSPMQIAPRWPDSEMTPCAFPPNEGLPPYGSNIIPLFTGDIRIPLSGGYAKPGQVALQQTQPLPMQISAIIPEFEPGDDSDVELPQRQQQSPFPKRA